MTGAGPDAGGRSRTAVVAIVAAAVVALAWLAVDLVGQCSPTALMRTGAEGGRAIVGTLADALKPKVSNAPLVVLRGEDPTPKLVVHTHAADVEIDLVEDTWYGDTYSTVRARNCRAQFTVEVDRISDRDVVFVPTRGDEPARIVVLAPRPKVDADMLAIAPESIEFTERNTGLRFARSWLGLENRDALVRQLRPRLLEAVSDPAVRARAEQSGREFFEKRFAEWLRTDLRLGRDVVVDVRWVE
ncbi:MAG: hypothetical protein RI990_781 [Planctomycetota bacterium]